MRTMRFALLSLCLSIFSSLLLAQSATSSSGLATAPGAATVQSSAETTPTADSSALTPIYEYSPPPAQYARAKAYWHGHYIHHFVGALYGFLILLFILKWRIAAKFRDLAERISRRRFVQVMIFAPLTLLVISVLTLPTDIWDEALERAFGLSVQKWPGWFTDWLTSLVLMLIVGTVLISILYAVIRRSPTRWWFYFWLASIPVLLIVFFVQPVVVDPLFFTFKPLADTQPVLVSEIEKITHRGGIEIPRDRMFLMNASTKTTSTNAYVTGFGSSKRVVIWDTTVAKATIPETLFVFGHEMGHYVLLHIPKEMSIISCLLLFLLYLAYRLSNWMFDRWGAQGDIRELGDWASLPMLIFVITLLAFFATPVFNAISRHFEHEADRYGIEVTHGIVPNANQVAAHYFEKSGELNLADPDPNWFTKAWFYDHPTRPERVHFVATYNPWAEGKEPMYVK